MYLIFNLCLSIAKGYSKLIFEVVCFHKFETIALSCFCISRIPKYVVKHISIDITCQIEELLTMPNAYDIIVIIMQPNSSGSILPIILNGDCLMSRYIVIRCIIISQSFVNVRDTKRV